MNELIENRKHFRLRQLIDVNWQIDGDAQLFGEGTIINVSQSGALLLLDKAFVPTDKCIVSIVSQDQSQAPFYGKKGKVVWLKKFVLNQPRLQFGIEFLKHDAQDLRFNQWLNGQIDRLSQVTNANILQHYVAN